VIGQVLDATAQQLAAAMLAVVATMVSSVVLQQVREVLTGLIRLGTVELATVLMQGKRLYKLL
jgi:hypothetical protein